MFHSYLHSMISRSRVEELVNEAYRLALEEGLERVRNCYGIYVMKVSSQSAEAYDLIDLEITSRGVEFEDYSPVRYVDVLLRHVVLSNHVSGEETELREDEFGVYVLFPVENESRYVVIFS